MGGRHTGTVGTDTPMGTPHAPKPACVGTCRSVCLGVCVCVRAYVGTYRYLRLGPCVCVRRDLWISWSR